MLDGASALDTRHALPHRVIHFHRWIFSVALLHTWTHHDVVCVHHNKNKLQSRNCRGYGGVRSSFIAFSSLSLSLDFLFLKKISFIYLKLFVHDVNRLHNLFFSRNWGKFLYYLYTPVGGRCITYIKDVNSSSNSRCPKKPLLFANNDETIQYGIA